MNSFKVVEKAVDFEIKRQEKVLESGEKVVQETRGWHDDKEITFSQREKEESHDYRYFPEPDLPPMHFDNDYIDNIKSKIPELPEQKRQRFSEEYGLDEAPIEFFVNDKSLSEYFEQVVSEFEKWTPEKEEGQAHKKVAKLVANYLITDVKGLLGGKEFSAQGCPAGVPSGSWKITPENFAEFIKMIYKGEISSKIAKIVLAEMFDKGSDPCDIIEKNNLKQIKDTGEIEKIVKNVISKNPKAVEDYQNGKATAIQFLVGQIMAETKGKASPEAAREILLKLLTR